MIPREVAALAQAIGTVDRAYTQAQQLFADLAEMVQRGAAPAGEITRYNFLAVRIHQAQQAILDLLRELNPPAQIPERAPFPGMFLNAQGQFQLPEATIYTPDDVRIYFQHPDSPTFPPDSEIQLGALPVIVWLGGLAVSGVVAYFGIDVWQKQKTERKREQTAQLALKISIQKYEQLILQVRWRVLEIWRFAERCSGKDLRRWFDCVASATEAIGSTPAPESTAELYQRINEGRRPKRSWLWWLGLGSVLVVGGVVAYQLYTGRRSSPRELPAPA